MKRLISLLLWCVLVTAPSFGVNSGSIEILSDTQGVDFGSYTRQVLRDVRQNWYVAIPPSAQARHADLMIEFSIMKDGKVSALKLVQGSGDVELDRAAWAGILDSNPFPPLPADFRGPFLALRFRFYYNPASGPAPEWDKGEVVGRTYKNASLGIELTPPTTLKIGDPEARGEPGKLPLLITINAASEPEPAAVRKVMAFYADALAYYPPTHRSTEDYMRRMVDRAQNDGYEPVAAAPYDVLGGIAFARHDFKKGLVYESALVKACDTQALGLTFAGANEETVNELIAETELKLDPVVSGCFSSAAATQNKPTDAPPSVTPSSDGQNYRVGSDVKPPRMISNPQPNYPEEARKRHGAGKIVVWMIVGSDGRPREVKVKRGISPELDQAAVDAAELWQFQPGTKDGRPVPVEIAVEFDFQP
jgi:TonB family protein